MPHIRPQDDAQAVIDANPDARTFVFTKGVHRGVNIRSNRSGLEFIGEPGAVISGAS